MPLYEYQCDRCGCFEVIRKFSDEPLTVCPTCGGGIQKLLSAPAIQFKGTGWYVTDYAAKSKSSGKGEGGKGEAGKGEAGGSASVTGSSSPTSDSSTSKPASESSSSKTDSKKSKD